LVKLSAKDVRRFMSKIEIGAGQSCWEWLACTSGGYGSFNIGYRHHLAHRVAYELFRGPIPPGMTIDHLCRNRACANPEHFEVVTRGENARRGVSANAAKTHCKHGHALTPENVYRQPTRNGRYCRTCRTIRRREVYVRQRVAA
jgi:hypothetical protein